MSSRLQRHPGLIAITLAMLIGSPAQFGCQPEAREATASSPSETWDAVFIDGNRVGYTHTRITPVDQSNSNHLQIFSESKLVLQRFGEKNEQSFQIMSVETKSGKPVRFTTRTAFGPTPIETTGEVDVASRKLVITTKSAGKSTSTVLPLPDNCRGFFGAEQSLREKPLRPGEQRVLTTLTPILNQVASVSLHAGQLEDVEMLDGSTRKLLRIDCVTTLPAAGQAASDGKGVIEFRSTSWVDKAGDTLKTFTDAMKQETYRTSRKVALADIDSTTFDLGTSTLVRLESPLENAHGTSMVRYAVEVDGGDPMKIFSECSSQRVKATGENTAEIVVIALRSAGTQSLSEPAERPTDGDRQPNNLVQSDDPRIRELADRGAPQEANAWDVAVALEQWVHKNLKQKNYSQAFASAAEVAQSLEGDCSEHAVLLAALLRSRGVPARVAAGLVYIERDQAFGYHMWTEAFINDRWIPLDATLGRGGIGGGHLKMLDTNLKGASALSSLLPVVQVLGRLRINVLEAG